jgi:hypothetical protein
MKLFGVNAWPLDVAGLEPLELLELEVPVRLVGKREFNALMPVLSAPALCSIQISNVVI